MIKKILVASLAVGALAFNAPVAMAEHAEWDCGFDTIAQQTLTGGQNTFTGVAYGYGASPTPGETVDVACWVQVNGTAVTPTNGDGSNVQADTFARQVTYTAADTDDVDLCGSVTAGGHTESACFETTTTQIPPQEVIDLINEILALTALLDPLICDELASLTPGIPGVVDITDEGDVYIAGIFFWDCPPYAV